MHYSIKNFVSPAIVLLFCLLAADVHAQDDKDQPTFPLDNFYAKRKPSPRAIFKNFRLSLSTGIGNSFLRHRLPGYGILQQAGAAPVLFHGPAPATQYSSWVTTSALTTTTAQPTEFRVNSDSVKKLGFKSNTVSIPIKATLHYEFERYRIGGGYSYEFMMIGQFRPLVFKDSIGNVRVVDNTGWMRKYFGLLGVSFYRSGNFLFTGDAQIGGYRPGRNFSLAQIRKGVYVNLGVTIERDLSEYLRVFVRPSFEIKNYTLNLPETGNINHSFNAFYADIGLAYTLPSLPKCYHPDCRIQMNHAHGDREYRSRVHPFYKKQNPMYGENHPQLFRYKRKNKKKLNPY